MTDTPSKSSTKLKRTLPRHGVFERVVPKRGVKNYDFSEFFLKERSGQKIILVDINKQNGSDIGVQNAESCKHDENMRPEGPTTRSYTMETISNTKLDDKKVDTQNLETKVLSKNKLEKEKLKKKRQQKNLEQKKLEQKKLEQKKLEQKKLEQKSLEQKNEKRNPEKKGLEKKLSKAKSSARREDRKPAQTNSNTKNIVKTRSGNKYPRRDESSTKNLRRQHSSLDPKRLANITQNKTLRMSKTADRAVRREKLKAARFIRGVDIRTSSRGLPSPRAVNAKSTITIPRTLPNLSMIRAISLPDAINDIKCIYEIVDENHLNLFHYQLKRIAMSLTDNIPYYNKLSSPRL